MGQAIGAIAGYQAAGSGASAVGLQAQLARYQKQLSESVHCASAKTQEGKAAIASLSAKISAIRERIDQVAQSASGDQAEPRPSATAGEYATASGSVPGFDRADSPARSANGNRQPVGGPVSALRTVGVHVDVTA